MRQIVHLRERKKERMTSGQIKNRKMQIWAMGVIKVAVVGMWSA